MPRYLQKLVARAGVAPFPTSLKPAFRAETTDAAGLDPLPEVVESLPPTTPALSEVGQRTAIVTPTSPPAPLHTIDIRGESIAPAPQVIRERTSERSTESRIEPRVLSKTETFQNEKPEIAKVGIESPQPATRNVKDSKTQPETGWRPTEQDVMSKLMPRLEAWFNQPSRVEEHAENEAREGHLAPPPREPESSPPLSQDETRLVIGQIRVDVLPPSPPAPVLAPQVVRIPVRSAQSSTTGTIAKLGFGLGQM